MCEDKRKYKRHKGKEGAFAAFIKPEEFIYLGRVEDISLDGLCVRYLATKAVGRECSGIKIFGSNDRFIHVEKVQCRIVYDYEIPEVSWEQLSARRCGVQFQNLSVRSLTVLQDFIDNFTHCEPLCEAVAG